MKAVAQSRIIRILCILLFLYELSIISYTGIRVMFPMYAYGGGGETAILEEVSMEQARVFLPVFADSEKSPVREKRKEVFQVKMLENGEMLTLMELENSSLGHEVIGMEQLTQEGQTNSPDESQVSSTDASSQQASSNQEGSGSKGNSQDGGLQNAGVTASGFVKHDRIAPIELSQLSDYETLVKQFYTIDAITTIGAGELNAEKLGNMDMTMKQTSDAPQILIYHTHSQEGYVDSIPGDDSTTIMGVGEHLKEILEREYGYNVIHHLGKYDVKTRDNAYSQSLPKIKKILEDNPSIEVVIDLHRDGVADESTRLVMDVDGRPTAKFMFFNGISRTKSTGKIDYLYNENLEANLAFSFQMKWKAQEYYPGLTRRNYLNAYRYNMHLCPKTLLLELGAQTNTLEEALNACDPIAHILHIVLSGEG